MQTFKRHDTDPPLVLPVVDATGAPVVITGWTGYLNAIRILDVDGQTVFGPVIAGLVTVVDGATGQAQYQWAAGLDLVEAGTYEYEVEWHKSGGTIQSTIGRLQFIVEEDITDDPLSSSMIGGAATVTGATFNSVNVALGTPANGVTVAAYREDALVAKTVVAANAWSLTLHAGSTYTIQFEYPGKEPIPQTINL